MLCRIEDAFRHVAQFTADASHELRTPLALIRTSSEVALLDRREPPTFYRDALERILHGSEKTTVLLDSLLRLARADSGTETSRPQRIDLCQSVRRACDQIALLAKEKGLALQSRIPSGTVFLVADPDHLARLWLILLDNAVKYTPRGGRIEVAIHAADRDSVAVEVRDSGTGIAAADLPHIFERFFRADKARRRQDGAGLGLALAKWIVDAHEASVA